MSHGHGWMTINKKAIFPREERSNLAYIVDFFALCSVQLSHRGSQVEEMLVAHVVVASHKMYRYTSSIAAIGIGSPKGVLHCKRCRIHSIVCQTQAFAVSALLCRADWPNHGEMHSWLQIELQCLLLVVFVLCIWLHRVFGCILHFIVNQWKV